MKRTVSAAIACVILLFPMPIQAAGWPMQGNDPQNTNFSVGEQTLSRQNVARLHATWRINGVAQMVSDGSRLYVSFMAGRGVGAFNARTGSAIRRWTDTQLGLAPSDSVTTLAYGNGLLVIASSLQVLALDPLRGRTVWRERDGATSLVLAGTMIYTGESCQSGCGSPGSEALDLQSGRVVWRHPGNFGGRPVVVGNDLYQAWGETTGNTHVYSLTDGALVGTLSYFGQWTSDGSSAFVQRGNGFLVGPRRARVLARLRPDGRSAWQVGLGRVGYADAALAYGRVYVTSNRFHPGVLAVDAQTGHLAWGTTIPTVSLVNAPSLAGLALANHVLFVAAGPRLVALNAASGQIVRQLPTLGSDIQNLLITAGSVYVETAAGITAEQL